MENTKIKKIALSGGGSGGPVTPLLALAAELLKDDPNLNIIFIGIKSGPVQTLVSGFQEKEIKFISIASGKWRRYFSLNNLLDIFKIIIAFFQSLKILKMEQPDLVVSAGGFVSVPFVWAAAIRKIPILIHQQDMKAGLANKLMAPFARAITVTFDKSLIDYGPRAILTGNPLRDLNIFKQQTKNVSNKYGLIEGKPLILVIGGGTGSLAINDLINQVAPDLIPIYQIIHLSGQGKKVSRLVEDRNYQVFEFLEQTEIYGLMAAADLVISRCGLGVLTELAAFNKPSILIPLPNTHQEENAALFKSRSAGIVLDQKNLDAEKLKIEIKKVLSDEKLKETLSKNIGQIMKPGAARNVAAVAWEMININEK